VEEITIAGTCATCSGHVAVGSDVLERGSRKCGSILIESMTIAGHDGPRTPVIGVSAV